MGSLTTPPCTEGVLWMVMKQPLQVSPDQISIFSRLYRNNARPVQPSNGRLIKESR
jgi:carbonic anhydrase